MFSVQRQQLGIKATLRQLDCRLDNADSTKTTLIVLAQSSPSASFKHIEMAARCCHIYMVSNSGSISLTLNFQLLFSLAFPVYYAIIFHYTIIILSFIFC